MVLAKNVGLIDLAELQFRDLKSSATPSYVSLRRRPPGREVL
jgi:hypothetical protein